MSGSFSPGASKEFDYASLDAETSQFVQQQTDKIRILMKQTAQDIIEIGQKLIEVKQRLGHGRFGDWLRSEFEWGEWTSNKFMQIAQQFEFVKFTNLQIAASALYILAAPSTPKAARDEALARAEAGEIITYTKAKTIKQKYNTLATKPRPKPEPVSQIQPIPTPASPSQWGSNLEIVPVRPQELALSEATRGIEILQAASTPLVPQLSQPVYTPEQPRAWWQLGRQHLLYCGNPNSPEFLERIAEEVRLLLAFPLTMTWQTPIQAETRIIATRHSPQGKDLRLFEDMLETNLLLYSNLQDLVVCCFVPLPEILSIINRLERRGLLAEPDPRRSNAIISDWKKAGLLAKRLS